MQLAVDILTWFLIIVGHLAIWCSVYNLIHATSWPRSLRKGSEKVIFLSILLPMVWVLTILIGSWSTSFHAIRQASDIAFRYGQICLIVAAFFIARWFYRKFTLTTPPGIIATSSELIDLKKIKGKSLVGEGLASILGRLPFNQIQKVSLDRKTIRLDKFPPELSGLRIAHWSDLHFTGQMTADYFAAIVELSNEFEPDLVFITGDIIDKIKCMDWIENVLGKLESKHGIYYVLGNHDLRIRDEELVRDALHRQGFQRTGGRWLPVEINGQSFWLAGNELPWFRGAESLPIRPEDSSDNVLKILLSHSPDQLKWAEPYDFDLMLAGHTHGGQIRLPIIGPIVAPSIYGIKYCSGSFQLGNMLMHVSRGLSGDDPIRINCPPELGLITLQSPSE